MGWLPIVLLALAVLVALWRFAGFNRVPLQLLTSALLIGIAGYALQGRPLLSGKPVRRLLVRSNRAADFGRGRGAQAGWRLPMTTKAPATSRTLSAA